MGIYNQYNGKLALISFLIYLIMLINGRSTFKGALGHSNRFGFVLICMILYSGLGFMEWDTYHYYGIYKEMLALGYRIHIEPFYYWLLVHLPHSYIIWRFVIWGTASILMVLSAKKIGVNATVFSFMVPLLFLRQFSPTRGSLGLALMVFCAILFMQSLDRKRIAVCCIAVLGLFASSFLHKSMVFFLIVLVVAYFIPLNKRTFVLSLILFPFLYAITLRVFNSFPLLGFLDEEQSSVFSLYQERENTVMNINGIIKTVFEKTVLVLLILNVSKKFLYDNIKASSSHLFLFKYSYVMIYLSFLFLGQDTSAWISSRTLHAACFPMVLCASYCFDTNQTMQPRSMMEKVIIIGYLIISLFNQFDFMRSYW